MANKLTKAEILAQIPHARERAERKQRAGLFATSVNYDRQSKRLLLELTNGTLLGVPTGALPELANASASQLSEVELTPSGGSLHFEDLDADFSIPGIVLATIGKKIVAKAFAGVGGSAKTPAKAIAARLNGAKGGRPRKHTTGKASRTTSRRTAGKR